MREQLVFLREKWDFLVFLREDEICGFFLREKLVPVFPDGKGKFSFFEGKRKRLVFLKEGPVSDNSQWETEIAGFFGGKGQFLVFLREKGISGFTDQEVIICIS